MTATGEIIMTLVDHPAIDLVLIFTKYSSFMVWTSNFHPFVSTNYIVKVPYKTELYSCSFKENFDNPSLKIYMHCFFL